MRRFGTEHRGVPVFRIRIRFRSKAPDNAADDEKNVLSVFPYSHSVAARPTEVSKLTSQADIVEHLHIEPKSSLECAGGRSCFAWI